MKREYIFDDEGLRDILQAAFRTGYVEGLFMPRPELALPEKRKQRRAIVEYLDKQMTLATRNLSFGEIVEGVVPVINQDWDGSRLHVFHERRPADIYLEGYELP